MADISFSPILPIFREGSESQTRLVHETRAFGQAGTLRQSTARPDGAFVEVGQEGATRDRLLQKAGISYASFYRALQPLLKGGLVTVHAGRVPRARD